MRYCITLTSLMTIPIEEFNLALRVFLTGFILLSVFGILHLLKYLQMIRNAAVEVGLSIITLAVIMAIALLYWWELGVMLILLTVAVAARGICSSFYPVGYFY